MNDLPLGFARKGKNFTTYNTKAMSIIKVWTPKGNWSKEEVCGLDKVHLIKCAVRFGVEYICSDGEPHFELNHNELTESDLIGDDLDRLDPRLYRLSESKSFLMPLVVLKRMADSELYLREVYKRLLELAEVPVGAGEDYNIMLKFENE